MEMIPDVNLYAHQMRLEAGMTELGINRFERNNAKNITSGREEENGYGKLLIKSFIDPVAEGIQKFMDACGSGTPGRRAVAFKYIKGYDPQVLAYLALRGVCQRLTVPCRVTQVASTIGSLVEDDMRYASLRKEDAGFYRWLKGKVKKRSALHVKARVAKMITNRRDFNDWTPWETKHKVLVGMKLLDILIETTGMVETQLILSTTRASKRGAKNKTQVIRITDKMREWIAQRNDTGSLLSPVYEPMVVPPEEWTDPFNGGYLSTFVKPLRLVKTRSKGYLDELTNVDLTRVYAAVNGAQNTKWRINHFILDTISSLWEVSSTTGGIPPRFQEEEPPRPWDIDDNEEARRAWRSEAAKVNERNREMDSKRVQFAYSYDTARRYRLFENIYFPHQLDFRGRMYAVPQFNPQGPDYMKALLEFSEGVPLGDDGDQWLAIHLANTGAFDKIDKAPLADRIAWVQENTSDILSYAEDPIANQGWADADYPFMFLAACQEWACLVRHVAEGEDAGVFVSSLPVGLDGSCSGIQHFSIAFRDPAGGAAVNLIPSEKPSDIYSLVADEVQRECLHARGCGDDEDARDFATQWLDFGITRGLCKRPTMTFGYGSRQFGFRDQIMSDTLDPALREFNKGTGEWPFEGDGFRAANYMAGVVARAVSRVVIKAAEAMDWLKLVAKEAASLGLPIRWETPDGFHVLQAYREQKSRRVETFLAGNVVKLSVSEDTPNVDKRAQAQGISPNFIHSLDASHLRMVVAAAVDEGITDMALVHDSFGTHAGNTGRFFCLIREQIVEMYQSQDVIGKFYDDIVLQLDEGAEVPLPPDSGDLDIEGILESDFCFA